MSDSVQKYSFTAVPLDASSFLQSIRASPSFTPASVSSLTSSLATSPLTTAILEYAREKLSEPALNHSLRVYLYGVAIAKHHFPSLQLNHEAFLLASLLHDIGTTDENITNTLLSFEYQGGFIAHSLLDKLNAPRELSEGVAEAIIRHQEFGTVGSITLLGQVLQLATMLDNVGANMDLVDDRVVEDVVGKYPRLKWSGCFVDVVRKEVRLKPWSHTTALGGEDGVVKRVFGNEGMNTFE